MIDGVIITDLNKRTDERGWLVELFRSDEIDEEIGPVMAYVSESLPGKARGPHEHLRQTDYFCFFGPSTFKVYLWDNRKGSKSYGEKVTFLAGEDEPRSVVIPPGVVHAYKNVGPVPGLVFNGPNRLYAGEGKKEAVDEVRHEDMPETGYTLD
ncbi:MAG: dTDP-4-dehydrorhamnose 3,5-epimerase family protein [Thermodesulfobacteriota bacterium]